MADTIRLKEHVFFDKYAIEFSRCFVENNNSIKTIYTVNKFDKFGNMLWEEIFTNKKNANSFFIKSCKSNKQINA